MEGMIKATKTFSQDIWYYNQNSNQAPLKYKLEVISLGDI
jgi:hypothetical protein